MQQFLEAEGIRFLLNAEVKQAQQSGEGVTLRVLCDEKEQTVSASTFLWRSGASPTRTTWVWKPWALQLTNTAS